MDRQNESTKKSEYFYSIMSTTNRTIGQNSLWQQNFNIMTRNIQQWDTHYSNSIMEDIPEKRI